MNDEVRGWMTAGALLDTGRKGARGCMGSRQKEVEDGDGGEGNMGRG